MKVPQQSPESTTGKMVQEKPADEELPRFGSVAKDPGQEEAEKIDALVSDLLKDDAAE